MPMRFRLLLAYLLAAVIVVGGGGWLFDRQLGVGLIAAVDASLQARAAEVEQQVPDSGDVNFQDAPERLPTPRAAFTQIFDPAGALAEASESIGREPLLNPGEVAAARQQPRALTRTRSGEPVRVLTVPVHRQTGVWVVAVGTSLRPGRATLATVRRGLLGGGAGLVLLGAAGVWLLAGSALRPVERMRRTAARIGVHDPGARVDVPATGDELAALANTLNDLLGRQEHLLRRQRRLVADAGHELRGPLAVLHAELELAAQPGRTVAELAAAVSVAAEETRRLTRLANNLLLLAQEDEGEPLAAPVHQPLAPVLRASVEAAASRAAANGNDLHLQVPDALFAPVDADRIRQAVDNLLDNALRVTPPGGAITVDARRDGATVVIEVLDRGPGFPPGFLSEAFERFRRADTARGRGGGGAGLGLAIVRAAAQAHGGRAEAANRPGGAAVRIILPCDTRATTR